MVYIMAFISTEITEAIADEITCINQDTIDKAISLGWSQERYLWQVFYVTQQYRGASFFGDGIGTSGTYILDVKDTHLYTMLKAILKRKGFSYTVSV